MNQTFHPANASKPYKATLCMVAALISFCLLISACIPEKMTISLKPTDRPTDSEWKTDDRGPDTKKDDSSPKIDLNKTENFYVGVMDVNLFGKMSPDLKLPLTNAIIGEFVRLNKFRVVDRGNRDSLLEEQGFQLSGCADDTCSVEVGRLLGVNRMVASTVSLVGNKYSINIQILNVETGEVEGVSERAIVCKEEDVLGWVKLTTRELFK